MAAGWERQQAYGRTIDQATVDLGLRRYMLSIYNYMTAGLILTGIVAMLVASSPDAMATIFGSPLKYVVMLAPFAFILFMRFKMATISKTTAQILFFAFSATMGLSLSVIFLVYTSQSIALCFFVAAGGFAATSLYGYVTKADLTRLGSFMFMGLIGIVIAGLINIFVQSSMLQFVVSAIGVLVFTGLTAYDTQRLKELYAESYDRDSLGKIAVWGALTLYLNFINLFLSLLQLFGNRR